MSDRVILYRNNGDNTFTDVTEKAGIKQINHPAGLTFIDFDHDGDVDLLVTGSAGSAHRRMCSGETTATRPSPNGPPPPRSAAKATPPRRCSPI